MIEIIYDHHGYNVYYTDSKGVRSYHGTVESQEKANEILSEYEELSREISEENK